MVRSMRRLFFVKPNLTEAQWDVMLHGRERAFTRRNEAMQFVLTRERNLLQPRFRGEVHRSPTWRASKFRPRGDGLD